MNKAIGLILPLLSLGSLAATAQSIPEKIDKVMKDPKRAENAARADVYIQHKDRKIADSVQQSAQKTPATKRKKRSKNSHKS